MHNRLPVLQTEIIGRVMAEALDEARRSAGILLFAYVFMPDHYHVLTDDGREIKEVLRFVNGISARRIINYLKENDLGASLDKLRISDQRDGQKFTVYQHSPNAFRVTSEDAFMQKVTYIHSNPVRAGLVKHPDDFQFSSARQWHNRSIENEPFITDHSKISWR